MDDLRDRVELRELVDRYASGVDHRRTDAVAALFTEDGALLIHEPGDTEPRRAYRGRAEIAGALGGLDRFRATHHLVGGQVLDFDGAHATGETYCTASHVYDPGPRIYVMAVRYQDIFVRVDGRWLIAERRELTDWAEDRVFEPR